MNAYISAYQNYLKSKRMAENTIINYTKDIENAVNYINKPIEEISYLDLLNWQANISNLSSGTVQRRTIGVRRFFDVICNKLHMIDSNPAKELEGVKVKHAVKVPLTSNEMRAMIDCAKNARDKAIISLLSHSAMRISEVINLTVDDFNRDKIVINSKGDKDRIVVIDNETREYINEYLKTRKNTCNNLFVSNQGNKMSSNCISETLKLTAKRTGIIDDYNRICNHLMRASRATQMADAGVRLDVIQSVLGHESIETTRIYVKTNQQSIQNAYQLDI